MNSTTTNNGNKINDTKSDELIINPLQLFSDAIKTIHNANSFTVMRLSNGMFPVQEFYVKGEGMMQRNRGTTYFTDIEGNYYDVYIEGGKIKLHESMISPQKNPFEDFKNELSTPIDMSANNLLDYQIEGEKIIIINKLPLSKKDFQRIYPRKFNEIYWAEVQDGINIKIEIDRKTSDLKIVINFILDDISEEEYTGIVKINETKIPTIDDFIH